MARTIDLGEVYKKVRQLELDIPYAKQILLNELFHDLANSQYTKGIDVAIKIHDKYR